MFTSVPSSSFSRKIIFLTLAINSDNLNVSFDYSWKDLSLDKCKGPGLIPVILGQMTKCEMKVEL